jgi:outer membrane lipoprotein
MKNRWYLVFIFLSSAILFACSTAKKFDSDGIDSSITPQRAVTEIATLENRLMLWGGVIISSINLADATQFEILAYPLTNEQRPDINKPPVGRFLALQEGYLEITEYAQGRSMTVRGRLQGKRSGHIGESDYIYPVLKIEQLHLWGKRIYSSQPQLHFGLGVQISN